METWEKEAHKKLRDYIKKGWVTDDAVIEWSDGEPFVRDHYILLPVGIINDCGCMPSIVLWL